MAEGAAHGPTVTTTPDAPSHATHWASAKFHQARACPARTAAARAFSCLVPVPVPARESGRRRARRPVPAISRASGGSGMAARCRLHVEHRAATAARDAQPRPARLVAARARRRAGRRAPGPDRIALGWSWGHARLLLPDISPTDARAAGPIPNGPTCRPASPIICEAPPGSRCERSICWPLALSTKLAGPYRRAAESHGQDIDKL